MGLSDVNIWEGDWMSNAHPLFGSISEPRTITLEEFHKKIAISGKPFFKDLKRYFLLILLVSACHRSLNTSEMYLI